LSIARKKRLVLVLLGIVLLWPLVHRALVAEYGLNPWKFFGFAMYCVPVVEPQVRLFVDYGERVEPLDASSPDFARLRLEMASFVHQRDLWGRVAEPDRVAAVVFELLTSAKAVEVEVIDPFFDTSSARIEVERLRYVYP